MRVVFLGTPPAAVPTLRALAASRHDVVAVATKPDPAAGRGRRSAAPPVKVAAQELGLPVLQPESLRAEFRDAVSRLVPDVFVVVAYGRLLGPRLLAAAPRGAVNVHFSLLPRWRGAAPVQRALLAGDAVTGVTTMRLVEELDAGPIYFAERTPIAEDEHAPALEARLAAMGAPLLLRTLDAVEAGAEPAAQDPAAVTLAPPLRKEEGWLDVRRPAVELARAVRAFDPWPSAQLRLPAGAVAVLEARVAEDADVDQPPGAILPPRGEDLPLSTGRGVLLLRRVRPEGRAAMTGRSLVNGRFVEVGQVADPPRGVAG